MKEVSSRVGIDWGSESHQVCRIDGEEEPKQRSFPHTGEGLNALVDFLVEGEMDPEQIVIAIEVNHKEFNVPCGYPARAEDIEMRMKQGFSVFVINWGEPGFKTIDIGRRLAGRPATNP